MPDIAAARPVSGAPIETSWGQQAHDAIEGIQYGNVNLGPFNTTTQSPAVVVTFPRPYATPPIVVVTIASNVCQARFSAVTTTSVTLDAKRNDGSATMTTQNCSWVAIGTPA